MKKKLDISCSVIHLLGISGGKSRKKDPAYDRAWRHGFLFHSHDCFIVTEGECSLEWGE
jgi:hypothetical protein